MDPTRRELFAAPLAGVAPEPLTRRVEELTRLVAALELKLTEAGERVSELSRTSPPVGTVIMWWGDRAKFPAGWEECDGGRVTTADALMSGAKPNLIDRFPKGAVAGRKTVTELSQAKGGTNNMPALKINALAGVRASAVPDHRHHLAQWQNLGHKDTRGNEVSSHGGGNNGANWTNNHERDNAMQAAGGHGHGLEGFVGSADGVDADGKDPTGANQPAYQEVFFLIRVK